MKLLFTGDINFRGLGVLPKENIEGLLKEVLPIAEKADFRIVNLEAPLGKRDMFSPIYKSGPNLICEPENVEFLKALKTDVATLANNHIGDFGADAIRNTIDVLNENGIAFAGAGENLSAAYKACYIEKDGERVAILSVCENEFGMATDTAWGSAGYNPRQIFKAINNEKKNADYVIVVFHGGNEFNPLPSPDTKERYRLICDMGADAVIAGHTHCPQGFEIYDNKPIIYSMGNFLFKSEPTKDVNDSWHYGYMTMINIENGKFSVEAIPYKFNPQATKITVFDVKDKEQMLNYIETLSNIIVDDELLEKHFWGWVYLHQWIPGIPKDFLNLEGYFGAGNYNLIRCESHLSQAQKFFELCYLDKGNEAKAWSETISKLTKMPV